MEINRSLIRGKVKGSGAEIVTVSSGKGGAGKTFFATNFAVELKKRGYRVLIFDADINLSNTYLLLNIDNSNEFRRFIEGEIEINEVIQKGVGGVDVLYAGEEIDTLITLDDQKIGNIVSELQKIENRYDYIIIDTQAGLHPLNLDLILYSSRNIIIANPEITSLVDLYKLIKVAALKKPGIYFDLVVNKVLSVKSATEIYSKIKDTVSKFRIRSEINFLGYILEDSKRVLESIQKRTPVVILHETGVLAQCFRIIVDSFLKGVKKEKRIPFFYFLFKR